MPGTLTEALRLAAAGIPVFPIHSVDEDGRCRCKLREACKSPGKHPHTQHGSNDATANLDTIKGWWKRWPLANLGIATGAVSGTVVIDIDKRNGGSIEVVEAALGELPLDTAVAETGGGGLHVVFRHPGTRVPCGRGIAPGIDIKADGGYIVVAPSNHHTGGTYEWQEGQRLGECELAACPEWLVKWATEKEEKQGQSFQMPSVMAPGTKHDTLFRLGCALRAMGFEQHAIEATLIIGLQKHQHPDDPDQVPVSHMTRMAADICGRYRAGSATTASTRDQTSISILEVLWRSLDIDALTKPPKARLWLIQRPDGQGVLPLGRAGVLAGEGGTGKTAAVMALAVCIVTGRSWFEHLVIGSKAHEGRVLLLLGEEDSDEIDRRAWTIAEALGLSPEERAVCAERIVAVPLAGQPTAFTTMVGGQLQEAPLLNDLRRRLLADANGRGWSLVVLDPLSRFAGGEVEASNEAATRFMQAVESICRAPGSPAVLVAAHSSKLARRQGQADVRGVTGITDAARWVATMRADGDEVVFAQTKSNYSMPMPELRLQWAGGVLRAVTAVDRAVSDAGEETKHARELNADIAAVLDVLRREGPMAGKDSIAKVARLRASRVRAAVDLAVARGLIEIVGTGKRQTYSPTPARDIPSRPSLPYREWEGRDGDGDAVPSASGTGTGRAGTAGRASDIDAEPEDAF